MSGPARNRWIGLEYALTIFLSAFLLFQVQPLISKYILPWFGGTPAVWTSCMLFFQVLLFAGYAYAHWITLHLSRMRQAVLHAVLLAGALLILPITPDSGWKPVGDEQPMLRIVALLAANVGLPFFLLSSTGPLLQRWFSTSYADSSPYRLYALSNLGSLLALISYPFVFEPALAANTQTLVWSWGFCGFALLCTYCAWRMTRLSVKDDQPAEEFSDHSAQVPAVSPGGRVRLIWFALAATASVMLLATTNQVCLDVAAVPFLWVLPLTLYLLSFILCFDSERWYSRRTYAWALAVSMAAVCVVMLKGAGVSIIAQVVIYFSGLFFGAMVCHGELVRLRPHPRYLTSFYLLVAAGGAAGGIVVAVIAPLIFPAYLELHLGILGCWLLAMVLCFRGRDSTLFGAEPRRARAAVILAVVGLASVLGVQAADSIGDVVTVSRNFYGVLRIEQAHADDAGQHQLKLMHGRILHGLQFVGPSKHSEPTAYYGRESGVGCVLSDRRGNRPHRVGVVGLGVGTVAAYARPGDSYRFYEINPDVIRLANHYFTYMNRCAGEVEMVLGDARLSLEREVPQNFDVLVLDAFSGDAIPVHLLTEEAFADYVRHLQPIGVLAVHISNLHFDLRPVVAAAAESYGLFTTVVQTRRNVEQGTNACQWLLASKNASRLEIEPIRKHALDPQERRILWTDERNNLFDILR